MADLRGYCTIRKTRSSRRPVRLHPHAFFATHIRRALSVFPLRVDRDSEICHVADSDILTQALRGFVSGGCVETVRLQMVLSAVERRPRQELRSALFLGTNGAKTSPLKRFEACL